MAAARVTRRPLSEINVVPYIDVMLVLLVIFMITTPLLTQGVDISLPHAKAKVLQSQEEQPIIVSVNSDGDYFLNVASNPKQAIDPHKLVHRVAAELELAQRQQLTRSVLVKGDKDVAYSKVVTAMVLLQQAGVSHVGLLTEDVESNG